MHQFGAGFSLVFAIVACASGSKDALDGTSHDVRGGTTRTSAYLYAARRPLVAMGVTTATGVSDDDTHRLLDRVADSASACFTRFGTKVVDGAGRIAIPIDDGGVVGQPEFTFSSTPAAVQGMICVLAPIRMSAFAPGPSDAGARSITIEAAWGNSLSP